ncbi:MAG: hypothetical protein HUJ31_17855, partial [Pseudomonadales bacterium]|nr:hypothetical protein [Pseudomonadales bacterium]
GKRDTLRPLRTLERGYATVTAGRSTTNVVKQATNLQPGDLITARLMQGQLVAEVREIENDTRPGGAGNDED